METYNAQIVELKVVHIYGKRISTSYATAAQDCPALWHEFAGEVSLDELRPECTVAHSYGVSIMTGPESFDYMAGVEFKSGESVPPGMRELALSAGAYLKCRCANLEQLGAVYGFMYESPWVKENSDYTVDFEKPCFEGYTEEYLKSGAFDVYAPLKAK